jgi:hypothetical protein
MYNVEIAIEVLQAEINIVYLAPMMLKILAERGCERRNTLPAILGHITNKNVVRSFVGDRNLKLLT